MKKGVIILLFALLSCQRAISQDLKDYRYYKLFEDSENIESLKTESADTVLLQPQLLSMTVMVLPTTTVNVLLLP